MRAVFDHSEKHTASLHSYWFLPDVPLRFNAGEYTELYIPHTAHDSRGEKRKFTISSSPTDALIGITVTYVGNGSSFKSTLAALQPGDAVQLAEAMGEFVLPKDTSIPLTFVAAGAGITPVMSIVRWLRAIGEQREVQIIHAVRESSRLLEQELFNTYAHSYHPIVTRAESNWPGLTGGLTAERIIQLVDNPKMQRYYLSGPENMIELLAHNLIGAGIDPNNIVIDLFLGVPDEQ